MLPQFTDEGVLPVGDYELTLEALAASRLVSGDGVGSVSWDSDWRAVLVERLGVLAGQLNQVGVAEIFVDGSFVDDKDHPNDIDGYFVCERDYFLFPFRDVAAGPQSHRPAQVLDLGPGGQEALPPLSEVAAPNVALLSGRTLPTHPRAPYGHPR